MRPIDDDDETALLTEAETMPEPEVQLPDEQRPSVPRLEDLSDADAERLTAAHNRMEFPAVRWADDEGTDVVIDWPD